MRSEPILSVDNLTVDYRGAQAVRNVSFDVHPGEVVAIVGESGSGKSSIALALMRLSDAGRLSGVVSLRTSDGAQLRLDTATERQMRRVRGRDMAMIFQEPVASLNPVYTIGAQLREGILMHGRLRAEAARRRCVELLESVGIVDVDRCLKSYPHQLSGGQCQRVGIAIAMANRPALLIADEPTTALDVTVQAQILEALKKLQAESNVAILFVTHDLDLVRHFADRVLVMYSGEIVESGATHRLFGGPLMPYTAALLASRPRMHSNGRDRFPLEPIPGSAASIAAPPTGCRFHPRCRHAEPGRCDVVVPAFELAGDGRSVRCARWRELA